MDVEVASGVLLACCALNLALAVALWTSAQQNRSAKLLALALVVLAGMMVVYPLGWTGKEDAPAAVALLPFNLPLALGPLLYGYVVVLAIGSTPRRKATHLAPAAALFTYLVVAQFLPAEWQAAWKETIHDKWVKPFIEATVLVSLTGYSIAALRILRRYRRFISHTRSDADRFAMQWITRVLVGLTITLGLLMAVRLYTWNIGEVDGSGLTLWLGVLSAYLGVEGWRRSERRFPIMEHVRDADTPAHNWHDLGAAWRAKTEAAEWWRDDDLTLADLAKRLGTNSAYLSRAINEGLGMNFNAMINQMRAQEVARQIDAGKAGNLTRSAFEAGFSSKATFNRAFQAACGMSPSAWRKRLKS